MKLADADTEIAVARPYRPPRRRRQRRSTQLTFGAGWMRRQRPGTSDVISRSAAQPPM